MSLQVEAKEISKSIEKFRSELLLLIESLPTNPAAIGSNNCFTITLKDLDHSWMPETHDFKRQYQRVAKILNKTQIEKLDDTFKKIYKNDYFFPKFHPQVIENIKTLWRPLNESNVTA